MAQDVYRWTRRNNTEGGGFAMAGLDFNLDHISTACNKSLIGDTISVRGDNTSVPRKYAFGTKNNLYQECKPLDQSIQFVPTAKFWRENRYHIPGKVDT
jgi:hypothetical protein